MAPSVTPIVGSEGKYQGRRVKVTEINVDGTLDLVGLDVPSQTGESQFSRDNVPATQFTIDPT